MAKFFKECLFLLLMDDLNEFKSQVKKSFSMCRSDIESLRQENGELRKKVENQEEEINELKSELKGLKIALDVLKGSNQESGSDLSQPSASPQGNVGSQSQQTQQKKDPYEELLKFKARANKREVLKQKLQSMINEEGISLGELKFLFVEHYNYCSKATFYNYLKELELEDKVEIKRERNKNFVYLPGAT